jgi:hypothetical protein
MQHLEVSGAVRHIYLSSVIHLIIYQYTMGRPLSNLSVVAEYCSVYFVYEAIRLLRLSYEVVQKPCAYSRMKVKCSTNALQSLQA